MKPLVIIPTYNERDNLPRLIDEIGAAAPSADLLVVDDNSPDGTGDVADRLRRTNRRLHVLHRAQKEGLGRAYIAGLTWALAHPYDPICTMDADFSHPPHHLPELIAAARAGADIALGSRYVAGGRISGWTWDRYLLSRAANLFTRAALGLRPRDVTAGYKCYRRDFLQSLELSTFVSPGYAFQIEMVHRAVASGRTVAELPIHFSDRTVGRSKVSRHELISSSKSVLRLVGRRGGVREAGKFGLVGLLNFFVDLGLTNLFVLGFHLLPTVAGYLGTSGALTNSFFLNRHWTFRAGGRRVGQEFIRFFIVNGLGALINALVYTFLLRRFGLWYNWAKIGAAVIAAGWNFLLTKYWVFQHSYRPKPPTEPAGR